MKRLRAFLRRNIIVRLKTAAELDGVRLDLRNMSLNMRDLILRGRYEVEEKQMCAQFLTPHDRVLEIGAAIGYIGLYCQKKLGISHYASVEANPLTFEMLLRNYELNGLRPVAWNYALSDHDGVVTILLHDDFWATTTIHNSETKRSARITNVPSVTTATLFQRTGFSVTALLIDIEGAEIFLRLRALPSTIDKVIIELHPEVLGAETAASLASEFAATGFRCTHSIDNVCVYVR